VKDHVKELLVCPIGLTPQVITETFYYLTAIAKPPHKISEIWVLTTVPGKKLVREKLLGSAGQFTSLCRALGIPHRSVKFNVILLRDSRGRPLHDIRTTSDDTAVAEQITDFIKQLTDNPQTVLHCSVAGGRKTMSVHLAFAMQLFGRDCDTMSHVLVDEESEKDADFYYPENGRGTVELINIPFVRFRKRLEKWYDEEDLNYSDLIAEAQWQIEPRFERVRVDVKERRIVVGEVEVGLQPFQIALYAHYARNKVERCAHAKRSSCEGCDRPCFVELPVWDEVFKADIKWAYGRMFPRRRCLPFVERLNRGQARLARLALEAHSRIKRAIHAKVKPYSLAEQYCVCAIGQRGGTRYGLPVDRRLIEIPG